MNTKITLSLIMFLMPLFFCQAQNIEVRTPKESTVNGAIYSEFGSDNSVIKATDLDSICKKYSLDCSKLKILRSASNTYNCISYALNITEGGPICWIHDDDPTKSYLHDNKGGDGSYQLAVGTADAEKILYCIIDNNGDISAIPHAAIKSTDPAHGGKYISKWGYGGPLVLHDPLNVPYEYTDLIYLKKSPNLIFGYYRVCDGGNSFLFKNTVSGTVTWTLTGGGPFSFSPTSSLTQTTTSAASPPYDHRITVYRRGSGTGNGTLKATDNAFSNITHSISIEPCTPSFSIEGNNHDPICNIVGRTFILKEVINSFNKDYSCSADWEIIGAGFVFEENKNTNVHSVTVKTLWDHGYTATLRAKAGNTTLAEISIYACGDPFPTYPFITCDDDVVCCDAESPFWLNNAPSNTDIYWTVSDTTIFTFNKQQWNQHNGTIYVIRKGVGTGSNPIYLSARANSIDGTEIASIIIYPCAAPTHNLVSQTLSTTQTITHHCTHFNLQDVTITGASTITLQAEGNIYLKNVTVTGNSRLILQAAGEVFIEEGFDVHPGSGYKIIY